MVLGAEGLMALDAGVLMLRGAVGPVGEGSSATGRVGTKVRRHRRSWVPENRGADDHVDVYPDDLGCQGTKVPRFRIAKARRSQRSCDQRGRMAR